MLQTTPCLLSINNYFYPRGGAEVVFFEQNRLLENIGWQVVPFSMQHPKNLPTPWASYFPDELEFGQAYVERGEAAYELYFRNRLLRNLQKHATHLGYHLVPNTVT